MRIFKFLATGAIGLSVNLGVFQILYVRGVPYLIGSMSALFIAMIVGFVLQKYWTFEERSPERTRIQFILYAALTLCNLGVNTLVVYLLVEYVNVYYLIAQAFGAGLVAFTSYLVYQHYIFVETPD